jgi:hypothetical protein
VIFLVRYFPETALCRAKTITHQDYRRNRRYTERVDAAEAAIHGRLRDLRYDSDHHEERQLMKDAQRTLSFLRRSPF